MRELGEQLIQPEIQENYPEATSCDVSANTLGAPAAPIPVQPESDYGLRPDHEVARMENEGGPQVHFPEVITLKPCSENVCSRGHSWEPKMVIAKCGQPGPNGKWIGCGAPVVVTKLENCPVCNEPTVRMRFRTDHVPAGAGGVQPVCVPGVTNRWEITEVELVREAWKRPLTSKEVTTEG
jgi:hypothetical protein